MAEHAKQQSWARRLRKSPHLLTAAVLVMVAVPVTFAGSASAAVGDYSGFTATVTDVDGANDVPAQSDLTQFGRNDTDPNVFKVGLSWDSTDQWTGNGQTGDACALFDTNGDGGIEYAVCGEIDNSNASTVVQTAASPTAWKCNNSKNDRCAHPKQITLTSGEVVSGQLGNPSSPITTNLITATDPFAAGSNNPDDSSLEMDVKTAAGGGFLPGTAAIANVCSYPSIGNGGNDKPFDCILTPAAAPGADLTKSASPTVYKAVGDQITYTLDMTNTGNVDLAGAVISDPLINATAPSYITSPCTVNGTAIAAANLPTTLHPNDVLECKPVYTITAADVTAGSVDNTATGNSSTPGFAAPTDTATVNLAAFTMSKSASPTTYSHAGDQITYTLDMKNTGTVDLTDAVISDPLINATAPNRVTSPCTVNGTAIAAANLPTTLHPNDVLECKPVYTITAADVTNGSVGNTATGHGTAGGAFTHTATATVTFVAPVVVPPPPGVANLTFAKSSVPPSGSTVHGGDTITYTLSYANTGNAATSGSTMSDVLPADTTFVSASGGGAYDSTTNAVNWTLGSITAGASGAETMVVTVANTATDGETIDNVAVLNSTGLASLPSNHVTHTVSVPVAPTPTLALVKDVNKTAAEYGDTLTYTFNATVGGMNQTAVLVKDSIPAGTQYVAGSADCAAPCTASESGGVVKWNLGNVAQGQTVPLTFKVTISTPATDANGGIPAERITNVGSITSAEIVDPANSNEVRTDVVAVLGLHQTVPPKKHEHSPLPFTGMPVPLTQMLAMSIGMIVVGLALTRPRRRLTFGPEDATRDDG